MYASVPRIFRRQESIIDDARTARYYIAGVYRKKASGARADRPELLRLIADLQPGEVVIAEKIDRISRLPLPEAEKLVATIRGKGARLALPGIVDLSEIAADAQGVENRTRVSARDVAEARPANRSRRLQGIDQAKANGKYAD
ncbi:recombinase family protein [Neorhizobium galegae]|uniref:recombinase family protein n=1 Tax=Neorhizobium galegae TaxID=399 RepID=UPI00349EDBA4